MGKQLSVLVDDVYRDLADENRATFNDSQILSFIRGGYAELNRVAPFESKHVLDLQPDPATGFTDKYEFDTDYELVFRAEVQNIQSGWTDIIPEAEVGQTVSSGWTFRKRIDGGGIVEFPKWWLKQVSANLYYIIVHGYGSRPEFDISDTDGYLFLSIEDEFSVRAYAKAEGYDLLAHDRSLFTQWQGQTNNTDVSPTQMMQMATSAKDGWTRRRGLIRTVRRYW